jgi:hypothetical protein
MTAGQPRRTQPVVGWEADGPGYQAPVVVLTYPYAGAERLMSLLGGYPALTCTSSTGILPLCARAAVTWRAVEGRRDDSALSSLAVTSTRVLTNAVITSILARTGGRRWCEFATAQPSMAEAFLQIYPQTSFLCLHRVHADVIHAALEASPWGLESPELAPHTNLYPERKAAALTAYWAARSESLIRFEEDHPDACRRVRYEDLANGLRDEGLLAFISLEEQDHDITEHEVTGDISQAHPGSGALPPFPADQVPAPLLAKAEDLASKLGYPSLVPN